MIVKYNPGKTGVGKFFNNWFSDGSARKSLKEAKEFFKEYNALSTEAEKNSFTTALIDSDTSGKSAAIKEYITSVDSASWSFENYKEWAKQAGIQTSSFTKLIGGAKKILTSFATSFISGLIFAGITKGLQWLYQVVDENFIHKLEHLKDLANDAAQAYSSEKSKAEQLNSELDSMNQQIDQLQAKGKLSFIGSSERDEGTA